jgi:hypothetical protein
MYCIIMETEQHSTAQAAHSASYSMGTSGLSLGMEQPEQETDCSPPSSVKAIPVLPQNAFMVCTDNFSYLWHHNKKSQRFNCRHPSAYSWILDSLHIEKIFLLQGKDRFYEILLEIKKITTMAGKFKLQFLYIKKRTFQKLSKMYLTFIEIKSALYP